MIQINLEIVKVIMRDKNLNPFYYFQPQENAQLYFDSFEQFKEHCIGRIEPNTVCHVELPNWNDTGFIASVDAIYMGWEVKMINADEARKQTKEKIEENLRKEREDIEALINDAIEKGQYSVYIDKYLKKEMQAYLINLGYDVKSSTYMNETDTRISWE